MVVITTCLKVLNVSMVTVEISYGSGNTVPQKDDLYEQKHPTSLCFACEKRDVCLVTSVMSDSLRPHGL